MLICTGISPSVLSWICILSYSPADWGRHSIVISMTHFIARIAIALFYTKAIYRVSPKIPPSWHLHASFPPGEAPPRVEFCKISPKEVPVFGPSGSRQRNMMRIIAKIRMISCAKGWGVVAARRNAWGGLQYGVIYSLSVFDPAAVGYRICCGIEVGYSYWLVKSTLISWIFDIPQTRW